MHLSRLQMEREQICDDIQTLETIGLELCPMEAREYGHTVTCGAVLNHEDKVSKKWSG
jgi:hypothetical protein